MVNMSPNRIKNKKEDPEVRKKSFDIYSYDYSFDAAKMEASRCLSCPSPRCMEGCPIHNNIPYFIKEIKNGNLEKAYRLIGEKSLLPDICSKVCNHSSQCMGSCIRGMKGESVNIGLLESFVSNWGYKNKIDIDDIKPSNSKTIAVIGSGPGGISFAIYMARLGYSVTIYEKDSDIGGVLYWGIPNYRLDKNIIKRYKERLDKLHVNIILNTCIGKDISFDDIKSKYDGIYISSGVDKSNDGNYDIDSCSDIYLAKDFLSETNKSNYKDLGKRVCIIGGGNVAMDCSRNAIRIKGVEEVKLLYRRTIKEMPASLDELEEAKEEGVEMIELINPYKFIIKNNKLEGIECSIMELGEPDTSGRRRPIESNKPHVMISCDSAILCLGFINDDFSKNTNLDTCPKGYFIVNEEGKTNKDYIYAGGDCVTGAKSVVHAMKAAISAAKALDRDLNNKE